MSNITDKELLSLCDLLNLRHESSTIGREYREDGTISEYHTIYTFLKAQYEWLKLMEESDVSIDPTPFGSTLSKPENSGVYDDAPEKYNKFQKMYKGRTDAGFYYNIYTDKTQKEIKEKKFFHFHKTLIRRDAPVIMEYFDRYDVSDNKSEHKGHFLDEWNIA